MGSEPESKEIDNLKIMFTGERISFQREQTSQRKRSEGLGDVFMVTGLSKLNSRGALISWNNGTWEVRGISGSEPKYNLARLARGLRITIERTADPGIHWMEIRIARITNRSHQGLWAKAYQTTNNEIDNASGFDFGKGLTLFGAIEIGKRGTIFNEVGNRKNQLCCTFPATNRWVPALVFAATRVLPMYHEWTDPNPELMLL